MRLQAGRIKGQVDRFITIVDDIITIAGGMSCLWSLNWFYQCSSNNVGDLGPRLGGRVVVALEVADVGVGSRRARVAEMTT